MLGPSSESTKLTFEQGFLRQASLSHKAMETRVATHNYSLTNNVSRAASITADTTGCVTLRSTDMA